MIFNILVQYVQCLLMTSSLFQYISLNPSLLKYISQYSPLFQSSSMSLSIPQSSSNSINLALYVLHVPISPSTLPLPSISLSVVQYIYHSCSLSPLYLLQSLLILPIPLPLCASQPIAHSVTCTDSRITKYRELLSNAMVLYRGEM